MQEDTLKLQFIFFLEGGIFYSENHLLLDVELKLEI